MRHNLVFDINDTSSVGRLRRSVLDIAKSYSINEENCGKIAIILNELSTNILKHSESTGKVLVRLTNTFNLIGIELISIDNGIGIKNINLALSDGYSTAGSMGTGLGAIKRLSDEFDVYSTIGKGTVVLSRVYQKKDQTSNSKLKCNYDIGTISIPKPGQEICGDDWYIQEYSDKTFILVVDGLGHGYGASQAAKQAVAYFKNNISLNVEDLIYKINEDLLKTRGAVLAISIIDKKNKKIHHVGIGNIASRIISGFKQHSMISHDGMVGGNIIKVQVYTYDWNDNSILVMNSDGLLTNIHFDNYPGLSNKSSSLISGVLCRDFIRGNDDATIIVIKNI